MIRVLELFRRRAALLRQLRECNAERLVSLAAQAEAEGRIARARQILTDQRITTIEANTVALQLLDGSHG